MFMTQNFFLNLKVLLGMRNAWSRMEIEKMPSGKSKKKN